MKFKHFLINEEHLDKNDIKRIVLNALGFDIDQIKSEDYAGDNLSKYASRNKILQAKAIKNIASYDEISKIVKVDYKKYTIGLLIDKITELAKSAGISDE